MSRPAKLVTSSESVPCSVQPAKPCSDCPWARTALAGWLGGSTIAEWLACAHSDARIECHALKGPQCAGAAIYRANMAKLPRDPEILRLPADRQLVFATPIEFRQYHERGPRKS